MPRLTITLPDELHRALKEAALRRGTSIRRIVEQSLIDSRLKTTERASSLVARARQRAGLGQDEALDLAVEETRAERKR